MATRNIREGGNAATPYLSAEDSPEASPDPITIELRESDVVHLWALMSIARGYCNDDEEPRAAMRAALDFLAKLPRVPDYGAGSAMNAHDTRLAGADAYCEMVRAIGELPEVIRPGAVPGADDSTTWDREGAEEILASALEQHVVRNRTVDSRNGFIRAMAAHLVYEANGENLGGDVDAASLLEEPAWADEADAPRAGAGGAALDSSAATANDAAGCDGEMAGSAFDRLTAVLNDVVLRVRYLNEVLIVIEELAGDAVCPGQGNCRASGQIEAIAGTTRVAVAALLQPLDDVLALARELRDRRPS